MSVVGEQQMTREELRREFETILKPAVDVRAPYVKVMVGMLVNSAERYRENSLKNSSEWPSPDVISEMDTTE